MTIVVTGGGSGGHITPILAVAAELKQLQSEARIVYIGQRGDGLGDIPARDKNIDQVFTVRAGKLRRYHGEGLKQLLDLPTVLKNLRDVVWTVLGLWQSYWLLGKIKPDCIFVKGGFVGVPVGLAAACRHIPYVTHDSDAMPGLANRIIARWAALHAVALPKQLYSYPADKTVTVGVPVHGNYKPVTASVMSTARRVVGLDKFEKVLLLTGGGLGAQRLNRAMLAIVSQLLAAFPGLAIVHVAGRLNENEVRQAYDRSLSREEQGRVVVKGYVTDFYDYSAAADVVIARAGATNLAEFAAQGKACIIVPNPVLTGGHQLKNAEFLQEQKAISLIMEADLSEDPGVLLERVTALLNNEQARRQLSQSLSAFAQPDAARHLAVLLLEQAQSRR